MLGLLPATKGPQRAHKLSDAVMSFVGKQLDAEPMLTATALAERIREHLSVTVHPRSISRARKRRGKKKSP
jgi:transposase